MQKLTLDVEKLTVDSFKIGVAGKDCPTASAGDATTSMARPCPFGLTTSGGRPCPA